MPAVQQITRENISDLIIKRIKDCASWTEEVIDHTELPSDGCMEVDGDVPVRDIADAILKLFEGN
jgi:hypothetical protein